MASAAILVGSTNYNNLTRLQCCQDDILAVKQLLEATEKYDKITAIENAEADALKSELRTAIDKTQSPDELFFYFTGHGYAHETEFFLCATNFDSKRPHETGVSTEELHTLLKLADARLVVKVMDACNSGTLLIKSENSWIPQTKEGFKNLIQFASCLDSQNSFTGQPLSLFTEKFRDAALRKTEGSVFYTDIISTLRDEFMGNNAQTPFFVSQYTGREQFVEDAKRLDGLRAKLKETRSAETARTPAAQGAVTPTVTLAARLQAADAKVVTQALMNTYVGHFFDALKSKISTNEFADFFNLDVVEHPSFEESTTERFIIRVLSGEKRPDNFVTASQSRTLRQLNPLFDGGYMRRYLDPDRYEDEWELRLNCKMERAQLKITFTPKFVNLRRIVLVASCAPSLDHCYVFEIVTQHMLQDFGKYDSGGPEASRRWWKLSWNEKTDGVVSQIAIKFTDIARSQLESAEKRLTKE